MTTHADLRAQVDALAPWHHIVALRDGMVTRTEGTGGTSGAKVMAYEPKRAFDAIIERIFPDGLAGRSFLDCGCNAGGFSFAAQDRGAGRIYGFDARRHWIDQAVFIRDTRELDPAQVRFEVATLEELEGHDQDYDITWFSGLFQHLPEPVAALQAAADRTQELLFLNSACLPAVPDVAEDPSLMLQTESADHPLSGIHGLGAIPSGPAVLKSILKWMGFKEVKTYLWNQPQGEAGRPVRGRVALVAARLPGVLDKVPDLTRPNQPVAEAMARKAKPGGKTGQPHGEQRPLRWEDDLSVHARDTAPFETIPPVSTWSPEAFVAVANQKGPVEIRDLPVLEMAKRDTAPLPVAKDREGYCGDNHEWYWLSGLRDYHLVTQAMARHGAKVDRLLDIGCASGRVLRHFAFQSDLSELWGAEINHRHVRFLSNYMPKHIRPMAVPSLPHYPVEDNYFDLITAFSVFTHIDVFETAFLAEIRRALKPGGLAYLTVSDESHWQAVRDEMEAGEARLVTRISKHSPGFAAHLKQPLGDQQRYYNHTDIGPYRGTIFTPQAHLRAVWERFFTIEEVIAQGHAQQTVVVLRK